jgi:hypothetical protein
MSRVRYAAAIALVLLVPAVLIGCSSNSDDDSNGTSTVEVVVTDKATGEPAAQAELDRARKIKTHIDTSDVLKVLPPQVVLDGDVANEPKGTPARALLAWWQAFQFRDVKTVLALTGQDTLKAVGRRNLAKLVRRTGLPGLKVLDTTTNGNTALIQAGVLFFATEKGHPPPRTPTGSKPATFTMAREHGDWVFAQTDFLALRVSNLQR